MALQSRWKGETQELIRTYGYNRAQQHSFCLKSETKRVRRMGESAIGALYAMQLMLLTLHMV
jgi:hypothetical protein